MENEKPVNEQVVENKKPNRSLLILFIVCLLILVSVGSFFLGQSQNNTKAPSQQYTTQLTSTPNTTITEIPSIPPVTPQKIAENTTQTYTDTDIPFSLSFPKNWILKKTYGKNIAKGAPTDVLSGIQINDPTNSYVFVVNVIDGKNATSIANWWQTGAHTTFNTTLPNFSFKGLDAIKVSSTPGGNPPARVQDETYFLWKGNVYFLSMQYTPYNFNPDLVSIYNSFLVPQR